MAKVDTIDIPHLSNIPIIYGAITRAKKLKIEVTCSARSLI